MKTPLTSVVSVLAVAAFSATVAAQSACPPEVASAKAMLTQKTGKTAKSHDVKAARSQAGATPQDVQAPRSQDVQTPRNQDVQAPRDQNTQALRSQSVQPPRAQASRAADVTKARTLVKEAEAACKAGDTTTASQKAKSAMSLLKS